MGWLGCSCLDLLAGLVKILPVVLELGLVGEFLGYL